MVDQLSFHNAPPVKKQRVAAKAPKKDKGKQKAVEDKRGSSSSYVVDERGRGQKRMRNEVDDSEPDDAPDPPRTRRVKRHKG